jgi:hypothetical protein
MIRNFGSGEPFGVPARQGSATMMRIVPISGVFLFLCVVSSAVAGEYGQAPEICYWCVHDAIYEDVTLIDHLEANPDVDESVKAPAIVAARADIHRLRATLGPQQEGDTPCCYTRKPLYIR